MANTISLSVPSVASDRTTFTITDGTVFTSPVRSSVGVFITVQKMNSDSTVQSVLVTTSDTNDPETDSNWVVPYTTGDGWYRVSYVAVLDYNGATPYSHYDLAFDPSTNKVYESQQDSNTGNSLSNTSFWTEIVGSNIALKALNKDTTSESLNTDSTVFEFIMTSNLEYGYSNQIALASEQYLTSAIIPDDVLDNYSVLSVLLNGAQVYSSRSQFSQGERVCQRLTSILESMS